LAPNEKVKTIIDQHPYTNGLCFLLEYQFGTIEAVLGRRTPKQDDIENGIRKVMNLYEK